MQVWLQSRGPLLHTFGWFVYFADTFLYFADTVYDVVDSSVTDVWQASDIGSPLQNATLFLLESSGGSINVASLQQALEVSTTPSTVVTMHFVCVCVCTSMEDYHLVEVIFNEST